MSRLTSKRFATHVGSASTAGLPSSGLRPPSPRVRGEGFWFVCRCSSLLLLCLLAPFASAAEEIGQTDSTPTIDRAATIARVDELLTAGYQQHNVTRAPQADDAEFLRRVSLDLAGVIPSIGEVREFSSDIAADKREKLIERLLASPSYARHLARSWRDILLEQDDDSENVAGRQSLENWLRDQFAENRRYDHLVADLLVATGAEGRNEPSFFYTARQVRPEELAAVTARVFLGVQVQCAQCHNHPFDHWTQEDFWGYAAFFSRVQRTENHPTGQKLLDVQQGEVTLPDKTEPVKPKYLEGELAEEPPDANRRRPLAIWMVSRENPYLARAAVNRVWARLFGRGLVNPVDDLGPHNPPSHPELLDELSAFFVASGYDLRELYHVLCSTAAYQASSQGSESQPELEAKWFARMSLKPLSADQLFDSLLRATLQSAAPRGAADDAGRMAQLNQRRQEFFTKFSLSQHASPEDQVVIGQALVLMNGELIDEATDAGRSGILGALNAPFLSDEQRVELVSLATLGRTPTDDEKAKFIAHLGSQQTDDERRKALGDVLWALVNSTEFFFNH